MVTLCLANSQGSQARFPHSRLSHDPVNKKPKTTNELIKFNLFAFIHITKCAN